MVNRLWDEGELIKEKYNFARFFFDWQSKE